ncbi:Palmytilated EEV envelope phospholipase-like protein [Sea otter poxvirus]|uniref:Palmytilated EEV envelope phospholipase-like protein n=1 Tax=Sea otter poxvirus TaxID=1416741 RepID=A0A2U9QHL6_9POXV|nr:Palmytilated EEV envelope phospholipase-like protein [Sea otter poxvirus]AWU47062.1 Palmytilated EEV envelope phospholipase-like protein [Sea otter poxvirus]
MWPFSSIPDGARCMVVETIPSTLKLQTPNISTLQCFEEIISKTTKYLHISTFCCNLTSSRDGENILTRICELSQRGIRVVILVDNQSKDNDKQALESAGVEYRKVQIGETGISCMLGNFWVSDNARLYIGGAALTGGSISFIKNVGLFSTCSQLANDLENRFDTFKAFVVNKRSSWLGIPRCIKCKPLKCNVPVSTKFHINNNAGGVFFSDSPEYLLGCFRTLDYDVITHRISKAQDTIDIALLSFSPLIRTDDATIYWPNLLNALLEAGITRAVKIRVLISSFQKNDPFSVAAIKALNEFGIDHADISVRLFSSSEKNETATNNTKLLIVDNKFVHITPANLDGTHYQYHSFVSANVESAILIKGFSDVFNRDWESIYSIPITKNIN